MLELNTVHLGSNLDLIKLLPDNYCHSIITDPPYFLSGDNKDKVFMNQGWDTEKAALNIELWKECLRVLKPRRGSIGFRATRTHHRLFCIVEDAWI